jgi:hypothetical protein
MIFRNFLKIILIYSFLYSISFSQEYYPLKIGNFWKYRYSYWDLPPSTNYGSYTYFLKVEKDTVLSNGHKYYQLSDYDFSGSGSKLVRADDNYIYYYLDTSEVRFFNLKA